MLVEILGKKIPTCSSWRVRCQSDVISNTFPYVSVVLEYLLALGSSFGEHTRHASVYSLVRTY